MLLNDMSRTSSTASVLCVEEELLFAWMSSNLEEENLKSCLSKASRAQKRQLFGATKYCEQNTLHVAAEYGSSAILTVLLNTLKEVFLEEKIDSKCQNGMTPLHYAAKGYHLPCIKLLLQEGADPNAVNLAKNTPLHIAALNFSAFRLPSLHANSYGCIKYLASQPDTNLCALNMDGKTPLGCSSNYWIQHIAWDKELHNKLDTARTQVARSLEVVTEWRYLCHNKPVHDLLEVTCPRLASFELCDCKLLTGIFYDEDCVQHFVTVKVIDAENDAHVRELQVLHKLRNDLSDVTKRMVNLNIGGGGSDIADYLLFPYYTLDLNSFLHYKSDNIVKLAHQAVTAVAALHSANIMHGDIKPHNFSVRVRQHSHFQVILSNFDLAVVLGEKARGRPVVTYYPEETDYLKYEHPWVSPEVYRMKTSEGKALAEASLAIDVFALGLLLGVAVDQECCQDRNKCLYEHRNIDKVLTSQMDLTMLFRPMRCRDDPLAKKMLVCATNMMCLVDPLQRCRMDDILREINM